jgi:hypothetical protein
MIGAWSEHVGWVGIMSEEIIAKGSAEAATALELMKRQFRDVPSLLTSDRLSVETLDFYGDSGLEQPYKVKLVRVDVIEAGQAKRYAFLLQPAPGKAHWKDAKVYRLGGDAELIHRANRHLKLRVKESNAADYAQFYSEFGAFRSDLANRDIRIVLPRRLEDIKVNSSSPDAKAVKQQMAGALWHLGTTKDRSRLVGHFHPVNALFGVRLQGWCGGVQGQRLTENKLRINRLTGEVKIAKQPTLHYEHEALLGVDRPVASELPSSYTESALNAMSWLGAGVIGLMLSLLPLVYALAWGITLAAAVFGVLSSFGAPGLLDRVIALPVWTTTLQHIIMYASATVIFLFAAKHVLWIDTSSMASLLRHREYLQFGWLITVLEAAAKRHAESVQSIDGWIWRIWGCAKKLVLWTFLTVAAFVALQIGLEAQPFGRFESEVKHRAPVAEARAEPSNGHAGLAIARVLTEETVNHLPMILYWRGLKPHPAGYQDLSGILGLLFNIVLGLVVIRGVHKFWDTTAPDSFGRGVTISFDPLIPPSPEVNDRPPQPTPQI